MQVHVPVLVFNQKFEGLNALLKEPEAWFSITGIF